MSGYEKSFAPMANVRVLFVVFAFGICIQLRDVDCVTVARAHEFQNARSDDVRSRYCDFSNSEIYNTTDLLLCMNELAFTAVAHSRNVRSPSDDSATPVSSRRAQYPYPQYYQPQYNYPPKPGGDYQSYYDRRPSFYRPESGSHQGGNSAYYDGGGGYPYQSATPFSFPGFTGGGLFDALSSISQYDDLKCVPRLLCEVATGVIPGSDGYRQNYDLYGGNPLIKLLTALDFGGGSSPLVQFGKSALTGYTSRGNPGACYREYPRCPRNNADLVDYLNNHNGGFFRFFGNNRNHQSTHNAQGNYYRGAPGQETPPRRGYHNRKQSSRPAYSREPSPRPAYSREPSPQPVYTGEPSPSPAYDGPEADRTGTGELRFDNLGSLVKQDFAKSFFPEKAESGDSNKVIFPEESLQEGPSLTRVSKSLSDYQQTGDNQPSFFPQGRKDQRANLVPDSNLPSQTFQGQLGVLSSLTPNRYPKPRLYFPDDPSNETKMSFTFPDGQKVQLDVAFSKLFSDDYKKTLRRTSVNDYGSPPLNLQGFSMVNLAELFRNDWNRPDRQVVHPCDMICHDSKGALVQFNQILRPSGSLSITMTPDHPILDISTPLPCEVICVDRRGERRQISTVLNQVLRAEYGETLQGNFGSRHQENLISWLYQRATHRRYKRNMVNLLKRPKVDKNKNIVNNADGNEKAASASFESMVIGDGSVRNIQITSSNLDLIPFFGGANRFLGMAGMSPDWLSYLPQRLPVPSSMPGLFGPPQEGIIQPFGLMPRFPEMLPIVDPFSAILASMMSALPPPNIVCSPVGCVTDQGSSTRALIMCNSILYFIPPEMMSNMPVCAMWLASNEESPTTPPSDSASTEGTIHPPNPSQDGITTRPRKIEPDPIDATLKLRQPEGEYNPRVSCLEDESWNPDVRQSVPIVYDKDVETDYTRLPGPPLSGVTSNPIRNRKPKKQKRKKLVIITNKGNITYVKTA